jgi:predicted DNA-binding protein (UPF0251 family)
MSVDGAFNKGEDGRLNARGFRARADVVEDFRTVIACAGGVAAFCAAAGLIEAAMEPMLAGRIGFQEVHLDAVYGPRGKRVKPELLVPVKAAAAEAEPVVVKDYAALEAQDLAALGVSREALVDVIHIAKKHIGIWKDVAATLEIGPRVLENLLTGNRSFGPRDIQAVLDWAEAEREEIPATYKRLYGEAAPVVALAPVRDSGREDGPLTHLPDGEVATPDALPPQQIEDTGAGAERPAPDAAGGEAPPLSDPPADREAAGNPLPPPPTLSEACMVYPDGVRGTMLRAIDARYRSLTSERLRLTAKMAKLVNARAVIEGMDL